MIRRTMDLNFSLVILNVIVNDYMKNLRGFMGINRDAILGIIYFLACLITAIIVAYHTPIGH